MFTFLKSIYSYDFTYIQYFKKISKYIVRLLNKLEYLADMIKIFCGTRNVKIY